jgi:hypothetical protein
MKHAGYLWDQCKFCGKGSALSPTGSLVGVQQRAEAITTELFQVRNNMRCFKFTTGNNHLDSMCYVSGRKRVGGEYKAKRRKSETRATAMRMFFGKAGGATTATASTAIEIGSGAGDSGTASR